MTYIQRLWRAELIGLISLSIVACIGVIFLASYGILFSGATLSKIVDLSELMAGVQTFSLIFLWGLAPVVLFGAPIFAVYLPNPAAAAWKIMFVAVLPGLIIQFFNIGFGTIVLVGGASVAITMLLVNWKMRPTRVG